MFSFQNRGYLWVGRNGVVVVVYTEKEHKRTLEGVRNALYLDLRDGFKGLCTHKNHLTVLKMIALSAFYQVGYPSKILVSHKVFAIFAQLRKIV